MTTRRDFLRTAALTGGAVSLGAGAGELMGLAPGSDPGGARGRAHSAPGDFRLLILGGTGFIGPHQVHRALERGHRVTIFNRGRTEPRMFTGDFADVEQLVGDRNGELGALEGTREWDAVVDNSGYTPEQVRATARLLDGRVGTYLFISTRSVFRAFPRVPMDVSGPLHTRESTPVPEGRDLPYGLAKALAEKEVRAAQGERTTIVRPSLIAGPGDRTDRFTYWPVRLHRGGEILAPGDPSHPNQVIDVRDLADFCLTLVERGTTGTFMALGPDGGRRFDALLYGIQAVTSTPSTLTWVDTDFLLERDVRPYADLPLWMPPRGDRVGFARFEIGREKEAGLRIRPLAETARDTLEWFLSLPEERRELRAGMSRERELELLEAWRAGAGG